MAVHQLCRVVQNLRRTTHPDEANVSDSQLLGEFIETRDEFAFAALVKRHSSMVWGVCRRIVAHHQDAEDAFQASFLVLATKANSIRPREMLANWLFGVAQRTALKARTMAAKRLTREKHVTPLPEPESPDAGLRENLEALLDQELASLPDKYRVAIILCDLEGKKGKDVAKQLQIPEGTLASRLRTGRVMLAKRLARHGVALSGGALATMVSLNCASAAAPVALISSTIHAVNLAAAGSSVANSTISASVAKLTEGTVKAMLLTKLKTASGIVLALNLVVVGGGLVSQRIALGQPVVSIQADERSNNNLASFPVLVSDNSNQFDANTRVGASERSANSQIAHIKSSRIDQEKEQIIAYPVLDLVLPMEGIDTAPNSGKQETRNTKEDWLIKKIMQTVSPKSWSGAGGSGKIEFFPLGKTLVVRNTIRVQSQVKDLLETMRRFQGVQIVAETKWVSLDAATLIKLRESLPQLSTRDYILLQNSEMRTLISKAQENSNTGVMAAPKITFFSGQRVSMSIDSSNPKSGFELSLSAFMAANLRHIEFDMKATVGQLDFAKAMRLEDGQTVAQVRQKDDGYLIFLLTPQILLNLNDEVAVVLPPDGQPESTKPALAQPAK